MIDPQMKRGLLDTCVLAVLYGGESYGYKIIKDLQPYLEISESTLYPILRRMQTGGMLSVRSVEHNNRIRRIYAITEEGKNQFKEFVSGWNEIIRVYGFITKQYALGSTQKAMDALEKQMKNFEEKMHDL